MATVSKSSLNVSAAIGQNVTRTTNGTSTVYGPVPASSYAAVQISYEVVHTSGTGTFSIAVGGQTIFTQSYTADVSTTTIQNTIYVGPTQSIAFTASSITGTSSISVFASGVVFTNT